MCLHTAIYVSAYCYTHVAPRHETVPCLCIQQHEDTHTLLYMCPHTAIYVSAYCYACVRILLYMCPHTVIHTSLRDTKQCPACVYHSMRTHIHCYICVRILPYIRILLPHTRRSATRNSALPVYTTAWGKTLMLLHISRAPPDARYIVLQHISSVQVLSYI
jgi:hypothetical protein